MADILEFDNARTPLHLEILRAVGLPSPAQWRLEGRELNPQFLDSYLRAVPHLVASCRSGEVCVIHLLPGATPMDVSDERLHKAVLDADIVRRTFERQGRPVTGLKVWLVFDDGDRIELRTSDTDARSLVRRAQEIARQLGSDKVSTAQVSQLL